MSITAKPCPFCGSTDLDMDSNYIECKECEAFGPIAKLTRGVSIRSEESREKAIGIWNKRVEDQPLRDSDIPYSDRKLIQRALANAKPAPGERDTPRWVMAKRTFGTGKTVSTLICYKFGFDPDGEVAAPYQYTGENS